LAQPSPPHGAAPSLASSGALLRRSPRAPPLLAMATPTTSSNRPWRPPLTNALPRPLHSPPRQHLGLLRALLPLVVLSSLSPRAITTASPRRSPQPRLSPMATNASFQPLASLYESSDSSSTTHTTSSLAPPCARPTSVSSASPASTADEPHGRETPQVFSFLLSFSLLMVVCNTFLCVIFVLIYYVCFRGC